MLRPTSDEDVQLFKRLCDGDRLEDQTCRPVKHGKVIRGENYRESWTYFRPGTTSPAGWVIVFDFNPRNRSAEFGYGVTRALRSQGIGREMLTTFFSRTFTDTDLNKLYCHTASFNTPSVRLLNSLGLSRDGVLRAHHERDGELHDTFLYSLLRMEFETADT